MIVAMLVVLPGVAQAAKPGNSPNAKACQKGGWQDLVTSTGRRFANQGECVSYAAKGGTLTTQNPYPEAKALCESYGGSFHVGPHLVDPSSGRGEVLWECNHWSSNSMPEFEDRHRRLNDECVRAGGLGVPAGRTVNEHGEEGWNSPCVRLP